MQKKPNLELFEKSYKLLNAKQKQAVDAIEGPVMVIAGPGTGKTTILTLRIANILKTTDTAPENILALTFTESATSAMRRKLADIIGSSAYKVNIHTFHGFAERIIGEYPDFFARIIGSSIIKDIDQIKIIREIVESRDIELLRPYGDPTYYIKPILREIHLLKRENISPDVFLHSVKNDTQKDVEGITEAEKAKLEKQQQKNLELAFVYAKYEEKLAKSKYYDFDDMLLELIRSLESSPEFKLMLQESFQYILADEHQDANASQNRILELLSDFHDSPNLFIVGDEKQAIYRFQGASLENFLYFTGKYKSAQVIDLVHNYRSHQVILDASHSLIEKNPSIPGRTRTKLQSLQVGGRPIKIVELDSTKDEYEYIAGAIKDIAGNKSEMLSEIAVLYRDNSHAKELAKVLKKSGIRFRIESDIDILSHDLILKIDTLLRAVHDPSNSEYLAKTLLFSEFECDPGEVRALYSVSYKNKSPLFAELKKGRDTTAKAYGRISVWSKQSREMQFTDFLDLILEESGIRDGVVASGDVIDRIAVLDSFYRNVEDMASSKKTFYLSDYVEYMDIIKEHGILTKKKYTDHVGGVRLMTAHKSKGLEFNYVFIIHANEGVWGNRTSRKLFHIPIIEHARDAGRIDDERRLFYVAMTRARESVIITYSNNNGEKDMIPSQFLVEIDSDFVKKDKVSAGLKSEQAPVATNPVQKGSKQTSILDPEFVKSVFLNQALSVTHLNNFVDCPWKYFFMNLIRIPKMEEKHQMYGTAVHATLRTYFDQYKNESDLDIKKVIALFAHELEKMPLSKDEREDSLIKGKKALTAYIATYYPTWNRNLFTEYAVSALLNMDVSGKNITGKNKKPLKITGKLDKVEVLEGGAVNVVDYKTGKPKSRNDIEGKTKTSDGNYMRQLTFYKLLLDTDGKFTMKTGELDFIEPNERGKSKKESFVIESAHTDKLMQDIQAMYDALTSLTFINDTCDDDSCEYCRLRKLIV